MKRNIMDLQSFRKVVDENPSAVEKDAALEELYRYAGLQDTGSYTRSAVTDAFYERIRKAFPSGKAKVRFLCAELIKDSIREHVILNMPLRPYLEVLERIRDALNAADMDTGDLKDGWATAVQAANDYITFSSWKSLQPERTYSRHFQVARAGAALKGAGYEIRLEPGWISVEENSEKRLVDEIEKLVATIGGLNVGRRLFQAISPSYDQNLQRYHLVPPVSMSGGGAPQAPWGYLLQLAVKHLSGRRPYQDTDQNWKKLVALATAYAAVIDVQPYVPPIYGSFDASGLLKHIQETALYDTMFRIPQLRPTDAVRLCNGLLGFQDLTTPTPDGWTLSQALEVVDALFSCTPDKRGPIILAAKDICDHLPHIPKPIISHLLDTVLCHPQSGSNKHFSRPTDAPSKEAPEQGVDFLFKPLIKASGRRFVIMDRAVAAASCPEALLSAFRPFTKNLETLVGSQAERFLEAELATRGVLAQSGDYDFGADHGECDIVVETDKRIVFIELKKKALTRKSRAGSDVDLVLDLAGSLLAAQAQCGWHEVRLRATDHLDLDRNGSRYRLERKDRDIERIAIALLDYGSFQDRTFLKHMMEATIGVTFSPTDPSLTKKFKSINDALAEISDQIVQLRDEDDENAQPFFHCWFLSLPQVLIMLDHVTDPESFWDQIRSTRHFVTGTSDFYHDFSYRRRMNVGANSS